MASEAEAAAMRRAIALSRTPDVPLGPNPRVGAIVLSATGEVISEGYHRGVGTTHAEVAALARAGARAKGAVAVVTLEPCNHTGRTGPCAAALIQAGVSRVVFAQADETAVAKGGAVALRAAGIDVEGGLLADAAAETNRAWTFAQIHRRPFVTWKVAATVDGHSAATDGTSRWITGEAARADVHRLRAQCDAILVGTGTVFADDPRLTVRDVTDTASAAIVQPSRAVMGLRRLPANAAVLDSAAPTVLLRTRDPRQALVALAERNCQHVWLEGGPTLASAFLAEGLVDEVVAYVAPVLLGAGRSAVADLGIHTMDDALRLQLTSVTRLGNDVRLTMEGSS